MRSQRSGASSPAEEHTNIFLDESGGVIVFVKPLSDESLCFNTCVILRAADNTLITLG